jgi:glycosyltransferase involved in cell wall biosynthesis
MTKSTIPLVSICVLAYNHEKYIRQAIESILSQKTDFSIEIIIGEDCSTDDTPAIVLEMERERPQIVRALLSPKNLGTNRNLMRTMEQCTGKYIALLGGDDFWSSPFKLKKQVEFLEDHPECTICFHPVEVFIQETGIVRGIFPDYEVPTITGMVDLIKDNYMPACSLMYRNIPMENMPEAYFDLRIEDWPLSIIYAKKGKIGYLNEIMAQYRVHSAGAFSNLGFLQKLEYALMAREFVYAHIQDVPKKELGIVIINNYFHIANLNCDQNNISNAREYLRKSLAYFSYYIYFPDKLYVARVFLRTFLPGMFSFIFSKDRSFFKRDS